MAIILTIAFVLFLIFTRLGNVLFMLIVGLAALVLEMMWAALVLVVGAIAFIVALPFSLFKSK